MKFTIQSNELMRILSCTGGVIPQKSTLPILENFLFELSEDILKVTTTDLDTTMSVQTEVKGMSDGKIAIPGKRLLETVRSLTSTLIKIEADMDSKKITMSTDNGEYKLMGESFENYPTISEVEKINEVNIDSTVLKKLINKTSFAVSTDELRPAMMGILLQFRKDEIKAVSTDGHRLVRIENRNFTSEVERDLVIPAKALSIVFKSANDGKVNIYFNKTHVTFEMNNIKLISRIIEDKYPNYESVIPVDNDKKLVVEKNQLLASVKRTSLYASSTTRQVRFNMNNGKLTVSAEDIDFGSEARETIKCEYTNEPMEVGFNAAYVVDILSHIDSDEVMILFSTPTRACIIQPTEQQKDENLLMLLMPVRLSA